MSPDPRTASARDRVHAWVVAQREDEARADEAWTAGALRGSVMRATCCAPLAALAGLPTSGQQALFTVGICAGLLAALTFGERWLTRGGPTGTTLAVLGGLTTWVLATGAVVVFLLQVDADFGELAWSQGPTAGVQALLTQIQGLEPGLLLFLSVITLPLAVCAGAYLHSADALWAMGPSCLAATVLACACVPLGSIALALGRLSLVEALATSCLFALGLWFYLVVATPPVLSALGACDSIEGWVFGRPLRVDAARAARR
ncbi:MAG: hypothetical protein KDD82_13290 [Planctomycetes bacterium]|nr:hypothetical protein [Planctomycetota bacterium]